MFSTARAAALVAVFFLTFLSTFTSVATAQVTPETPGLSIRRITPVGADVTPANQIVIEFNRPVVPLGRMDRSASELPITISPTLSCKWRWINRQALACNLDEQARMAEATRYTVTVNPGIKAMDGAIIASAETSEFIARRPNISNTGFKTWRHPGVPVLRVIFNQPVSRRSIQDSVWFAVEGDNAAVGVSATADPDDRKPGIGT